MCGYVIGPTRTKTMPCYKQLDIYMPIWLCYLLRNIKQCYVWYVYAMSCYVTLCFVRLVIFMLCRYAMLCLLSYVVFVTFCSCCACYLYIMFLCYVILSYVTLHYLTVTMRYAIMLYHKWEQTLCQHCLSHPRLQLASNQTIDNIVSLLWLYLFKNT